MAAIENAKAVILKDGRLVKLRTYDPSDKEGLVSMYAGLSQEYCNGACLHTIVRG